MGALSLSLGLSEGVPGSRVQGPEREGKEGKLVLFIETLTLKEISF
jgi:hypothetical protein